LFGLQKVLDDVGSISASLDWALTEARLVANRADADCTVDQRRDVENLTKDVEQLRDLVC